LESTANRLNVMIAAGGTGGHLFPAQALAHKLLEKHPEINITFIGAGLNTNHYFKKEDFSYLDIKSGTPFKKHPAQVLKALLKLVQGTLRSFRFFVRKKPDVIVGFGSFHTFPAILAAKLRKIPIVIFESNALPGKVNRYCSKWAKVSAIQFSHAGEYLGSKSICVHMPIPNRSNVSEDVARKYYGLDEKTFTFLVFGGSQGAEAINRFFCGAMSALSEKGVEFQVIHIIGLEKRAEKLIEYYKSKGIPACVKVFEDKMEYAWAASDLTISRSGAATLSEMIEYAVPSILIPYPYGTENHQGKNAAFIADEIKGAICLEEKGLNGLILADHILKLMENSNEKLHLMRENLKKYREEESKQDLCSVVLKTL